MFKLFYLSNTSKKPCTLFKISLLSYELSGFGVSSFKIETELVESNIEKFSISSDSPLALPGAFYSCISERSHYKFLWLLVLKVYYTWILVSRSSAISSQFTRWSSNRSSSSAFLTYSSVMYSYWSPESTASSWHMTSSWSFSLISCSLNHLIFLA